MQMANYTSKRFGEIKTTSEFWNGHPEIKLPDVKPMQLAQAVSKMEKLSKEIAALDQKRLQLDGERDRLCTDAMDVKDRVRKGAVATLGNDAPALRQLGLKPKSERRRPTKKAAPKGE